MIQDQAMAIICELCDTEAKHIDIDVQNFCRLLLQIMEMTLYLEHCVVQICGIRTVLGRVEDFSREVKLLLKGKIYYCTMQVILILFIFQSPLLTPHLINCRC